jgi:hypothetical protein
MVAKRKAAIKARERIHRLLCPISKTGLLNAARVRKELRELPALHYIEKNMVIVNDNDGFTWTIHRSTNFSEPPDIHCLSGEQFERVKEICRNLEPRWCSSFTCAHWFSMMKSIM